MPGQEQARKPAPLAQLVHDLNQPLSAINTYAQAGIQMIDNGITDTGRLKELFGKIAMQCGRATLLSRELGQELSKELSHELGKAGKQETSGRDSI